MGIAVAATPAAAARLDVSIDAAPGERRGADTFVEPRVADADAGEASRLNPVTVGDDTGDGVNLPAAWLPPVRALRLFEADVECECDPGVPPNALVGSEGEEDEPRNPTRAGRGGVCESRAPPPPPPRATSASTDTPGDVPNIREGARAYRSEQGRERTGEGARSATETSLL